MNSDDTVTSKEAAFMLDTDMEQDMQSYRQEITLHVIKTINRTPELYDKVAPHRGVTANVAHICKTWARERNDEFGDLFITELEDVEWTEVARRI